MRKLCRLLLALTIVLGNLGVQHPALAFDAASYFSFSYSVKLSKTQVLASEVFQAAITGQADCFRDLPISVSEGYAIGRLVAVNAQNGSRVVLVPSYTLSLKPFPKKKGESTQQTRSLDAAFPATALPGRYDLVAELIEARVKALIWFTVTSYLPQSKNLGSITVVTPATFVTSGLTLQPTEDKSGAKVTITVTITNSGDLEGTYQLVLSINGDIESTRLITLPGRTSVPVNFVIERQTAGVYQVRIDGLSGSFTINKIGPITTTAAPSPIVPPKTAPPTSASLPIQTTPATTTTTVEIASATPSSQPQPSANDETHKIVDSTPAPSSTPSSLDWWIVGSIVGAGVAILLFLWMGLRLHRRFHRL